MKKKLTKTDIEGIKKIVGAKRFIIFAFEPNNEKTGFMMGRFQDVGLSEKLAVMKELIDDINE